MSVIKIIATDELAEVKHDLLSLGRSFMPEHIEAVRNVFGQYLSETDENHVQYC